MAGLTTTQKLAILDATGRHGMSIETFDSALDLARAALYRHAADLLGDDTSTIENLAAEIVAQIKADSADANGNGGIGTDPRDTSEVG
jgi:hypothetical protein